MGKRLSFAAKKRRQAWAGRLKLAGVAALGLCCLLFGASVVEVSSKGLGLMAEQTTIAGNNRVSEAEIRGIIASQPRQSMALLPVAAVREELQALPWVRAALVTKQWPNTLHVSLYEHTPLALMHKTAGKAAEPWIMAKSGALIVPAKQHKDLHNLTRVAGNPPLAQATHMVRQASASTLPLVRASWESPAHATDIQKVASVGHWRLQTAYGQQVLTTPQHVASSLNMLQNFATMAHLDTRVPGRIYVKEGA